MKQSVISTRSSASHLSVKSSETPPPYSHGRAVTKAAI